MGLRAFGVSLAASIAGLLAGSCSLVSGLNQLEKVGCTDVCDGGPGGDGSMGDGDASGADGSGIDVAHDGASGSPDTSTGGASAYPAAVLADSPVGYWRLGDAVGTTMCKTEDGLDQPGTVAGGVTFGVPGALKGDSNTAAQFDGTTTEYIDVGAAFTFTGTAAFSWEVWVRPAVLDNAYRPFFCSMTFDDNGDPIDGTYMVSYSVQQQTLGFERYRGTNKAVIALDVGGLQVNVWTYIVGTSDAQGNAIVYQNGNPVLSSTSSGNVPTYMADTILGQQFKGDLDEIAIYDHALSAQAVMNHWIAAQ